MYFIRSNVELETTRHRSVSTQAACGHSLCSKWCFSSNIRNFHHLDMQMYETDKSLCLYTTLFSMIFLFTEMSLTWLLCFLFAPRTYSSICCHCYKCLLLLLSPTWPETLFSSFFKDLMKNKLNWVKCQKILFWLIYLILMQCHKQVFLFLLTDFVNVFPLSYVMFTLLRLFLVRVWLLGECLFADHVTSCNIHITSCL